MEKIYCTSTDGEYFGDVDYATKEDAIVDMRKELENGDEFYIGIADRITKEDVANCVRLDQEELVERMMCDCEAGDVAEDWLGGVKKEEWEELNKIVVEWLWKKDKPTFYRVKDVEKFIVNK